MIRTIIAWLLGLFMLAGGVTHFVRPEVFDGFVPAFLPNGPIHILAGVTESAVGLALIIPTLRRWGGLALALVCLAYTPLHIWDLFRPDPVIAPQGAAIVRLLVQFALIYAGYSFWRRGAAKG